MNPESNESFFFTMSAGTVRCSPFSDFSFKSPSDTECLVSCVTKLQIFGPK